MRKHRAAVASGLVLRILVPLMISKADLEKYGILPHFNVKITQTISIH
ncbi:hypothetical protein [Alteribacillus sp. HJP-4]